MSRDTEVVGDIHFSGTLDIEGLVRGNIVAQPGKDALVRVVDAGSVEGEIRAPAIMINGRVDGDVHAARHLELASKARVHGDVFYTLVEMAVGSEVNGRLMHVDGKEVDDRPERAPDPAVEIAEVGRDGAAETALAKG
ncbi:bactofilin family protein [Parahaliea mediterranea]|uniref:bactofilin family protein n=1 Tax=Parahaliea mediterranea TaxID=651086 RepID=UPI00321BE596